VNGYSAGIIPSQVNKIKMTIKVQKDSRVIGDKLKPELRYTDLKGNKNKTRKDLTNATTPPNLLGIERRIA